MPRRRTVFTVPGSETSDGLAHVTWATDGNLNKAAMVPSAAVTAPRGIRRFKSMRAAIAFGNKQQVRMGEGTYHTIHAHGREPTRTFVYNPPGPNFYRWMQETPAGRKMAKKIGWKPRGGKCR